ncbi:hypothetical protein PRIPAC_74715, partial [Pristionchus pacificus]
TFKVAECGSRNYRDRHGDTLCCDNGTLEVTEEERIQSMKNTTEA